MRHFIFSFNSGGFLQPTTELLSEGLAASVLEAGCPDTREGRRAGGPAATLTGAWDCPGGSRLCRQPPLARFPALLAVCLACGFLSLKWEEAPPAGLW